MIFFLGKEMRVLILLAVVVATSAVPNPVFLPLQELFSGDSVGTICPDKKSTCNTDSTCCRISEGYGCCPFKDGVCCSGGEKCCPHGYVCDNANQICQKMEQESVKTKVECPDGGSCNSSETCCMLRDGHYGCCPTANANCCSDGVHCCPQGETCDVAKGECIKNDDVVSALLKKRPAIPPVRKPDNIVCPDDSECNNTDTCCKLKSEGYGCCPTQNAVCCSDGIHCCVEGTTCDEPLGCKNENGDIVSPMLKKRPASAPVRKPNDGIVCPNGGSCDSGQTCCMTTSGVYGCCPRPNAVCCADEEHCCPEDTTCNTSDKTCNKNDIVVSPMLKKQPIKALPPVRKSDNIVCPDGGSCNNTETCCKTKTGYGCCPRPNAVCCSDEVHCCAEGTTCDVPIGCKDENGDIVSPMLKKRPTSAPVRSSDNVVCPDGGSCGTSQTCCKLESGHYGCCPEPDAVCCNDGIHCCPHNTECDSNSGTCSNNGVVISPMLKKQPTSAPVRKPNDIVCPDRKGSCDCDHTCCKTTHGVYGCCPGSNAVCCADNENCCPEDTTCDTINKTCNRNSIVVSPMLKKQPFKTLPPVHKPDNIVCPDKRSECNDNETCCKVKTGGYGCCPNKNAVCCSDEVHCCPEHTTCDTSTGTCLKDGIVISQMLKKGPTPAIPLVEPPADAAAVGDDFDICPNNKVRCIGQCCPIYKSGNTTQYWCCNSSVRSSCCASPFTKYCCPYGKVCYQNEKDDKVYCRNPSGATTWFDRLNSRHLL